MRIFIALQIRFTKIINVVVSLSQALEDPGPDSQPRPVLRRSGPSSILRRIYRKMPGYLDSLTLG